MAVLSPCPFCGGKPNLMLKKDRFFGYYEDGDKELLVRAYVYCGKCRARGGVVSVRTRTDSIGCMSPDAQRKLREEAAVAWNRRVFEPLVILWRGIDHGNV